MDGSLHVLSRRDGARARPRVVLDPSLSLSFQLPAAVRAQKLPVAESPRATPATCEDPNDRLVDDDDSWESKDWGEPSASTETSTGNASALRRVVDRAMAVRTMGEIAEEEDGEEEWGDDAPELPDDFPVLVVNLSRLRDLHFRSESENGGAHMIAMDTDEQLREFYATVKQTLHEHFTQMTEVLFEQEVCIHTHYGSQRRMLENLHRAYPTHVFALIDYPTQLAGLDLHEYLHVLSTPTRWPSVNYLKDCLRKCSRDLEWKFEIVIEIEKLAQQEHDWWTREQQRLSDEIDTLTRLRDSFREKLNDDSASKKTSQYMLLRKLEDIETRLMTLIDTYLKEPELTERESRELVGFKDASPSMQMRNVLDMVVAMIFSRLPRDYGSQPTREAHFDMLLDHHIHIRRLWKKDFGRLPARMAAPREDGGEEDEEEEQKMAEVHQDEVDAAVTKLEDDFDQFCHVQEDEEELNDDWEAIADDPMEIEEAMDVESEGYEDTELAVAQTVGDGLDGYGADYDSNESGSEDEEHKKDVVERPPVRAKRVARRIRRTKVKKSASLSQERSTSPIGNTPTKSDRDRELEAFMYGNSNSDSDGGGRLFQSYARTGALQLLRRAKENEGF